jgi:hypothetical protein
VNRPKREQGYGSSFKVKWKAWKHTTSTIAIVDCHSVSGMRDSTMNSARVEEDVRLVVQVKPAKAFDEIDVCAAVPSGHVPVCYRHGAHFVDTHEHPPTPRSRKRTVLRPRLSLRSVHGLQEERSLLQEPFLSVANITSLVPIYS